MSAVGGLAQVIAVAIEQALRLDEERVRQLVREVLAAELPRSTTGWATPPKAAKKNDVGVKRVYALMASGQVEQRLRNLDPGAKAKKYEINLASLERALRGEAPRPAPEATTATDWATRRLAAKSGAR